MTWKEQPERSGRWFNECNECCISSVQHYFLTYLVGLDQIIIYVINMLFVEHL